MSNFLVFRGRRPSLAAVRRPAAVGSLPFLALLGANLALADTCTDDLRAALSDIGRGDAAVAEQRRDDAALAFRVADRRLRRVEDHCPLDLAETASKTIDMLLTKRASLDAEARGAGCALAVAAARRQEQRALVQATARMSTGDELDRQYERAQVAWSDAVALCGDPQRQQAETRLRAVEAARSSATADIAGVVPGAASAGDAAPEDDATARAKVRAVPPKASGATAVDDEAEGEDDWDDEDADAEEDADGEEADEHQEEGSRTGTAGDADLQPNSGVSPATSGAGVTAGKPVGEAPVTESGESTPAVRAEVLVVGSTRYAGDFRRDPGAGTVSGRGKVEWSNGDVFVGTLVRGKAEGEGEMRWAKSGSRYQGQWRNDLQNGRGVMEFADRTRYDGDFVDGHLTGRGRYEHVAVGETYEGDVVDGKPHGRGVYTWKNGDRYDGEWRQGRKEGQGRYVWADGSVWAGEYRNDQRTENGRIVSPADR